MLWFVAMTFGEDPCEMKTIGRAIMMTVLERETPKKVMTC